MNAFSRRSPRPEDPPHVASTSSDREGTGVALLALSVGIWCLGVAVAAVAIRLVG